MWWAVKPHVNIGINLVCVHIYIAWNIKLPAIGWNINGRQPWNEQSMENNLVLYRVVFHATCACVLYLSDHNVSKLYKLIYLYMNRNTAYRSTKTACISTFSKFLSCFCGPSIHMRFSIPDSACLNVSSGHLWNPAIAWRCFLGNYLLRFLRQQG